MVIDSSLYVIVDNELCSHTGIEAEKVSSLPSTLRDYSSCLIESEADIIRSASRVVQIPFFHSRFLSRTKKRRVE